MEKEKNVSLDKKEIIKEFFLITGMYEYPFPYGEVNE